MSVRYVGGWAKPRDAVNTNHMRILITGGAGFLGTHLTQHFLRQGNSVVVASRDEAKHWKLKQACNYHPKLETYVWNAADSSSLNVSGILHSVDPDVLVLAHAMKRIDVCEAQPEEAIATNVTGIQHLLGYIKHVKPTLRHVVLISTDKAANPISVYGTTKLLAEQLMRQARGHTKFVTVRYGNVLESTGSVIPTIREQLKRGALYLTDPDMTRFIFTVREAVQMVDHMITENKTGLWIPAEIPSMRMEHLFQLYSEKHHVPVEHGKPRAFPEKIHEILNTDHEQIQWYEREDGPVPIRDSSCPYKKLVVRHTSHVLSSHSVVLTKQELKELLERENLL